MEALKQLLPPVKSTVTTQYDHSNDPWFKQRFSNPSSDQSSNLSSLTVKSVPPYLKQAGFVPRKPEDFGDGGAFSEIHVVQYPPSTKNSIPNPKIQKKKKIEPVSNRERRIQAKELAQARKKKRKPHYNHEQELGHLWEKMRRRNVTKQDRSKMVSEAVQKMMGKMNQIRFPTCLVESCR